MQDHRTCGYCCRDLRRHQGEILSHWLRREHCNKICLGLARRRAWVSPDGPPWTLNDAGCWIWDGSISGGTGYGKVSISKTESTPAHRWVYEQFHGQVPPGLDLDHLCRIRACVNPSHLEPVTAIENVRRGLSAKLTAADVTAIRRRYAAGGVRQIDLAGEFGVSSSNISMVVNGRTWSP